MFIPDPNILKPVSAFDIYLIGSDLCTKDPNPTNFQIVSGFDQNTETRIPDYGYDDRK